MVIRYRCDFGPAQNVITDNFARRGWEECAEHDDDYDVWWASCAGAKQLFNDGTRLHPGQLINHFPNHYELTRKDLMVKNIKRYQIAARRLGAPPAELDIIPTTFVLPQDFSLFAEEFRKTSSSTWIMKPAGASQGKGIFLINKLSQLKAWSGGAPPPALRTSATAYVVSRYVECPLLIGGKKFDLRLYVLVTSYRPLTVYMSSCGFARFCNVKYSSAASTLDNEFVHLTNVAIQKTGLDYNSCHGNKWPLQNLRLYLEATHGASATAKLFRDIEGVVIKSLQACQAIIVNDSHCFELYGYDVIIDSSLKPWLIEVNASPSLSTTTKSDRLLKFQVINDTLNTVTPAEWMTMAPDPTCIPGDMRGAEMRSGGPPRPQVGSMQLIYHEAAER